LRHGLNAGREIDCRSNDVVVRDLALAHMQSRSDRDAQAAERIAQTPGAGALVICCAKLGLFSIRASWVPTRCDDSIGPRAKVATQPTAR
jgi:hypothetical protein